MSYTAIAWAYDLPVRGNVKPVLVALANFADEAGECYPGQEKLADMTGMSLSSVRRALKQLEDMALISRMHRYDDRGYRTSDRFHLSVGAQLLPVTAPTSQDDSKDDRLPVSLQPPTGQPAPPTGHSDRAIRNFVSYEPSEEPSEEEPPDASAPAMPPLIELVNTPETDPNLEFDRFWAAYPRKASKPPARRAWTTAVRRAHPTTIVQAAQAYRDDPNRSDAFTKLPATWLNADAWNDGPLPKRDNGGRESSLDRRDRQVAQMFADIARSTPHPFVDQKAIGR